MHFVKTPFNGSYSMDFAELQLQSESSWERKSNHETSARKRLVITQFKMATINRVLALMPSNSRTFLKITVRFTYFQAKLIDIYMDNFYSLYALY